MAISDIEKLQYLTLISELKSMTVIDDARDNFYSFCKYFDPEFFTENKKHLIQIADSLQQVADGKIKKLMISLPPRAGKSYITSLFCAWMLGKNPSESIMRNSYAATLAEKFSYDIRYFIQTDKFLKVFPDVELKRDKQKIEDWALTEAKQTSYFCAGVGGAITGKGCSLLAILDDPIKNAEDAFSETILEKTWQWYTSTHKSRLEKGCAEIQIATRWSRRDPIGMLLDKEPDQWTKIVVPALDENGQSFCDEIKTTDEFNEIRKLNDSVIWEAEYMQNPIEAKGLLFPIESLKRFTMDELKQKPSGIEGYTDTADLGDDYLSSPLGYVYWQGKEKHTYITDVVFTQDAIELTEPAVAEMLTKHNADKNVVESNSAGRSFSKNLTKLLRENGSHCIVKALPNTQNKETRILMKSGLIKEYFHFRSDYEVGSEYDKFMRQLTNYIKAGKNKHDDAPDSLAGLADNLYKNSNWVFV